MALGILLIVSGIVVAIYPQVLIAIVAGSLVGLGMLVLLMRWQMRQMARQLDRVPPLYDFFIRF